MSYTALLRILSKEVSAMPSFLGSAKRRLVIVITIAGFGAALLIYNEPWKPRYRDKTLDQWKVALRSSDPEERSAALETLKEVGEPAIPLLIEALDTTDDTTGIFRFTVAESFQSMGPIAVPYLVAALGDPRENVRSGAVHALQRMLPNALQALTEALGSDNVVVRRGACWALGGGYGELLEAVPILRRAMKDPDGDVRLAAAVGVARIDLDSSEEVLAELLAGLKHEKLMVRWSVLETLVGLGKNAVPTLISALRGWGQCGAPPPREWRVSTERRSPQDALRKLGPKAIPGLVRALRHEEEADIREGAAWTLALMGKEAEPALPTLKDALSDGKPDFRLAVAVAMCRIQPEESAKVIDSNLLADGLSDPREPIRVAAARGLGLLGPSVKGEWSRISGTLGSLLASVNNSPGFEAGLVYAESLMRVTKDMRERMPAYQWYAHQLEGVKVSLGTPQGKTPVTYSLEYPDQHSNDHPSLLFDSVASLGTDSRPLLPLLTLRAVYSTSKGTGGGGRSADRPAIVGDALATCLAQAGLSPTGNPREVVLLLKSSKQYGWDRLYPSPRTVADLCALTRDPDTAVKRAAVWSVALMAPSLTSGAKDFLNSENWYQRQSANSLTAAPIAALVSVLESKDPSVRIAAVWGLGEFGHFAKGSVAALETVSREDPNDEVKAEAEAAVARCKR
jgi:HEAT repeat protein